MAPKTPPPAAATEAAERAVAEKPEVAAQAAETRSPQAPPCGSGVCTGRAALSAALRSSQR
jgi:hypothetical protein